MGWPAPLSSRITCGDESERREQCKSRYWGSTWARIAAVSWAWMKQDGLSSSPAEPGPCDRTELAAAGMRDGNGGVLRRASSRPDPGRTRASCSADVAEYVQPYVKAQ